MYLGFQESKDIFLLEDHLIPYKKLHTTYDLLKYLIYASFYVIVIKTGMDFYEYKRFPKLYEPNSAPWYTEALLYCAASFAVIIVCFALRVIIKRKMKKG